jgi:hypothetical protein
MRLKLLLGLIVLISLSSCLGGGETSTETGPLPVVAGKWEGEWIVSDSPIPVTLNLSQSRSSISGTFSSAGLDFPIKGSVDSNLGLAWKTPGGSCTISGDGKANSLSPTIIEGSIDFDARGCSSFDRFQGPVRWMKSSRASVKGGRPGSMIALASALKALAPR